MGLINSALQIGRSAITSYQSALSIVGNNIANAADPDYTRQRAIFNPLTGAQGIDGIQPGGGIALTELDRVLNESLEQRLRTAISDSELTHVHSELLSQIETSFNELTDNDLSSMMSTFFNAMRDVQNNPTDLALRDVAIGHAQALASAVHTRRSFVEQVLEGLNDQVITATERANEISEQVAELNVEIVAAEAAGQTAGALRDQRDALLRELSEIVDITVRHQEGGTINVFIGNESLVQLGNSRGLSAVSTVEDGVVRYQIRFSDTNAQAQVGSGLLGGLQSAGQTAASGILNELDRLAGALINGVNAVHANGQGLVGYSSLSSDRGVLDPNAAINDAGSGLSLVPRTGSFFISMTDEGSGTTTSYEVSVDLDGVGGNDTTLNSLIDQINANVPNMTATLLSGNKLSLASDAGFSFSFGNDGSASRVDTSSVLAALGVNTFFNGTGAEDIRVSDTILADARNLAAASGGSERREGDGTNAGLLADVADLSQASLGNVSVISFYNRVVADLGVRTAAANARTQSSQDSLAALEAQRASISGVSLDEEAIELLKYERAFEGSARFTSVVNQLIDSLLLIVR